MGDDVEAVAAAAPPAHPAHAGAADKARAKAATLSNAQVLELYSNW